MASLWTPFHDHSLDLRRHQQRGWDKVFATEDAAETWLQENDREGVAFEV